MELAEAVYLLTRSFPREEAFVLTPQLRRASVSTVSNIAEGKGRLNLKELAHFLGIARGSVLEVETQLLLAIRVGLCAGEQAQLALGKADEVRRILNATLATLKAKQPRP